MTNTTAALITLPADVPLVPARPAPPVSSVSGLASLRIGGAL